MIGSKSTDSENLLLLTELSEAIQDTNKLDSFKKGYEAGLKIYRRNYFHSLLSVLVDYFPTLEAAIGKENFKPLCRDFAMNYPSDSENLDDYGLPFPKFVAQIVEQHEWPEALPQLAELDCLWHHPRSPKKGILKVHRNVLAYYLAYQQTPETSQPLPSDLGELLTVHYSKDTEGNLTLE